MKYSTHSIHSGFRWAIFGALLIGSQTLAFGQLFSRQVGAREVVYDFHRNVLIVSIPGENKLLRLNPRTLTEAAPPFQTTGNPTHLALSASGNTLYVGFDTAPEVSQIDLATWSQVRRFELGVIPVGGGTAFTYDIAVKPDNDDVIAVALREFNSVRGVAVYDQGLRLPNLIPSEYHAGSIVFGTNPTTLFGADVTSSERGFREFAVDAQGITLVNSVSGLLPSGTENIVHANNIIYTDSKSAFHGPTATLVGMFSGRGMTVASPTLNRVFIIDFFGSLMSFELDTFSFVEATHRLGQQGSERSFTNWGEDGFAFTTSQGFIYSLRSSLAWNQVRVIPTSLSIVRGSVLGGDLASLTSSDNGRLQMRPGVTFTTSQAPVEIEIKATSPVPNPTSISLSVESRTTSPAVRQRVSFYDYTLGTFVAVDERPTETADLRIQCDQFDNGSRFVHPTTGEMRARIAFKANGPVITFPWSVGIDLARWVLPQ